MEDGFPTTNIGNDEERQIPQQKLSCRRYHSLIPAGVLFSIISVTFRSAKRAGAVIKRRPLSEPCELGPPSVVLRRHDLMWLTWVTLVLGTFAETKVARLPGRTPASLKAFLFPAGSQQKSIFRSCHPAENPKDRVLPFDQIDRFFAEAARNDNLRWMPDKKSRA